MLRVACLISVALLGLTSGCSMCAGTFDCHYAAFGGVRQRGDRIHGRVGSAFNNAEAIVATPYDIGLAPEYEIIGDPVEDSVNYADDVILTAPEDDVESLPQGINAGSSEATSSTAANNDTTRSMQQLIENANQPQQPRAGGADKPEPFLLNLEVPL